MEKRIFAVYKPKGLTSFDVVRQIKKLAGERRVGHAGTLDPLADGVLVVGVGREATRKLGRVAGEEKEYVAEIKLGETSTTDDEEGAKVLCRGAKNRRITEEEIEKILKRFVGEIMQAPPRFSAIKVGGRRAYKLARRGEKFALKPRRVFIKSIEFINYKPPVIRLRIVCGKGVYIRSLARDVGEKLGTGGYLAHLTRTRVGNFTLEAAKKLPTGDKNV